MSPLRILAAVDRFWERVLRRPADWLRAQRERRRMIRDIDPDAFLAMAGEIRELAQAAGAVGPQELEFQGKIRRILVEMDQLGQLAGKPEFKRLSLTKRLLLRQNLIESREQLMEAVKSAPSPTTLLQ